MQQTEIAQLLPEVFRRTVANEGPLRHLLGVMESLHEPSEDVLRHVDEFFDPLRARDDFIPLLARWMDLDWLMVENPDDPFPEDFAPLASGTGRLRELVFEAVSLSKMRGTVQGLVHFMETATGVRGFVIDENVALDGSARAFHLVIKVPAEARRYEAIIHRIAQAQKPAYVTYELNPIEATEGGG